jgi:hypothetical protein
MTAITHNGPEDSVVPAPSKRSRAKKGTAKPAAAKVPTDGDVEMAEQEDGGAEVEPATSVTAVADGALNGEA